MWDLWSGVLLDALPRLAHIHDPRKGPTMGREKATQLSFTRISGVKEVACTVCGQLSDTPILANQHFATTHPEKLCPATKQRISKTSRASKPKAPRPAAASVKAKAESSAPAA